MRKLMHFLPGLLRPASTRKIKGWQPIFSPEALSWLTSALSELVLNPRSRKKLIQQTTRWAKSNLKSVDRTVAQRASSGIQI